MKRRLLDSSGNRLPSSTVNANQKGRSYLALADYFYGKPDFMKAGIYYDSTVIFLESETS